MDKTKECPGCAMEIVTEAEECPICGYKFPKRSKAFQILVWVLIILLILWWVI